MCLIINKLYHPKYGKRGQAFIAEEPILVYKRLINTTKTGGKSPFRGTPWEFGVETRVRNFTYGGGMHRRTYVRAGLHAFLTKPLGVTTFPAVIPEGARFFIGEYDEIVSTALTVYRTKKEMLSAFGVKYLGSAIRPESLTTRAR